MRKPQRLFIRPPAPTFPWWAKLAAGLLLVVVSLPLAPKPAIAPAPSRAQLAMQLLAPLPAEARHDPAPPPRLAQEVLWNIPIRSCPTPSAPRRLCVTPSPP